MRSGLTSITRISRRRFAPALVALAAAVALLPGGHHLHGQARPAAARVAAAPDVQGFAADRLARMRQVMQGLVDRQEVAGAVTLIWRNGQPVDLTALGWQDAESKTPMRTDTIFRIASMTKFITSVAAMILYEEGRFLLTDPVSRYIPAFAEMRVVAPGGGLVRAERPITIRDLLTHRSGLTYGFIDSGTVGDAYRRLGVSDGLAVTDHTIEENINLLAKAPLVSQPGREYHYSLSVDVLGRLVEVAAGTTFERFLQERLFDPLKMTDTSFIVESSKWPRLATAYTPEKSALRPMRDPETFQNGNLVFSPAAYYRAPKKLAAGGAGLTSTAADYARFLQMMLNGGELDGVRILGRKTVELMTTSHTHDVEGLGADGTEWGLGVDITTDLGATQALGSVGAYTWGGIYGTNFWVDPQERIVGVLMVQRYPASRAAAVFRQQVYQALVK